MTKAGKNALEIFESQASEPSAPSVGGQVSSGGNNRPPPKEGGDTPGPRAEYQGEVTSHKHQAVFEIQNLEELGDNGRWRQRWIENHEKNWQQDETNNTYYAWINDWKARLTKERVYIHIPERRGQSVAQTMDEVMQDVLEARDWLEEHSPMSLSSYPVDFDIWMSEHHLGLIDHPLALWIKEQEGLELKDFSVWIDGEERVFTDDSPSATLEAASDFREEDMRHLEDRIEWILRNKETDERLRESIPEEMDSIEDWFKFLLQLKSLEALEDIGQEGSKGQGSKTGGEQRQRSGRCEKFEGGKCEQRGKGSASMSDHSASDERLKELEERLEKRMRKFSGKGQTGLGRWKN